MELSYSELKKKDVINIIDGKSFGKVCDIVFNYPQGVIFGIVVPGKKGWNIFKCCNDIFIDYYKIKKIGTDVILVDIRNFCAPNKPKYDKFCGKDRCDDDVYYEVCNERPPGKCDNPCEGVRPKKCNDGCGDIPICDDPRGGPCNNCKDDSRGNKGPHFDTSDYE